MKNFYTKKKQNKYESGNDGYRFLENKNSEFLKDYKISAGFDFYVPTSDIFPNPKDYFAIRDYDILLGEINNIFNSPYMCIEDFSRIQRVDIKTNNIVQDTYDTIVGNYQKCINLNITQCDILAFRCIFRFINKKDQFGNIIIPDDIIINKLIDKVFRKYSDHTIITCTNKFTNTVHFLISNIIGNMDYINEYSEYYNNHGKNLEGKSILFSRNIYDRFTNLQNDTDRFLYFDNSKL